MTRQEKMEAALRAIAEGYPCRGEDDRYIIVENPNFKPDNGSDPNIVIDTAALSEDRVVAEPGVVNPAMVEAVRADKCFSCGLHSFEACKRSGDKACGREHFGGSRQAIQLAPPDSAPSGEAVREATIEECARIAEDEPRSWLPTDLDPQHRIAKRIRALTAPGASVTYESAIEPNYVVETYKSIDRNLGASVEQNSSDGGVEACGHAARSKDGVPAGATSGSATVASGPSDPTPQDAKAGAGVVPEGYEKLPGGMICKCMDVYRDVRGQHWCCMGKPIRTLPPAASKPVTVEEIAREVRGRIGPNYMGVTPLVNCSEIARAILSLINARTSGVE